MRTRFTGLVLAAALMAVVLPSSAFGLLTNEYGMWFAGQGSGIGECLSCHDAFYGETLHARHVTPGIAADVPSQWTEFKGVGSVPPAGAVNAGLGSRWYSAGGAYPITGLTWLTMFDYDGGSRWSEEYGRLLFFSGSPATSTVSPWNQISNLGLTHEGTNVEYSQVTSGLADTPVSSTCGMVNCHFTGGTQPLTTAEAAAGRAIPNPAVASQPTTQTKTQWARGTRRTAAAFNTSATVGLDGLGVQCEKCHGSGLSSSSISSIHFAAGTQLSHRLPARASVNGRPLNATGVVTLGRSDVCGACHGLRSATPTGSALPYLMGYTPNLPVRDFVSVNATRTSTTAPTTRAAYTYTPTESEFASAPAVYAQYPNGNPKDATHGGNQYWSWASSAHSVRAQTGAADPDGLPGAANTHFSLTGATTRTQCLRCHTGEGYLTTKAGQIDDGRYIRSVWEDFTVSTATAGFMGQECVTCHDPHPAGPDPAYTLRDPDPAGVRSNLGRSIGNASVCEDCHNWQIEVMSDVAPAELDPQALPSRVSHPQREVLHGRSRDGAPVMWDVADMGEFMPGVKCEDCHMPKTDVSGEYTSHRMMIQMPGEAAGWGATGQDSCTTCHEEAGATVAASRTAMQAAIDGWQAEAGAAAEEASVAVAAARVRPEYTSGASGARELYGRAWLNRNVYLNDGSAGVHNPPYVIAGLRAAAEMADAIGGGFDQSYATGTMTVGSLGAVAGHVDFGTGDSAAGAKVALERWSGTTWIQEGSTTAGANGSVAFMVSPAPGAHRYRLRWDRCLSDSADVYSRTMTTTVVKMATRTSLYASSTSVSFGSSVRLYGSVAPSEAGRTVSIQARYGTAGAWRNVATATLTGSGTYSRVLRPTTRGYWYYRTRFSGTATLAASASSVRRVDVR